MGAVSAGVVLDGTRVAVVTVANGKVTAATVFDDASAEEALKRAKAALAGVASIRAVVVSSGVRCVRVDVSDQDLSRANFSGVARRATGVPELGTSVAGYLYDLSSLRNGNLSGALAVTAPTAPIARLYRLWRGLPLDIVPAAFTSGPTAGLALYIGFTAAELSLAAARRPVAFQQMATGGLASVAATLGAADEVGAGRLMQAMTHAGRDVIADQAIRRYLLSVLRDVSATVCEWERQGFHAPKKLYVHGPAADAWELDQILAEEGFTREQRPSISAELSVAPLNVRPLIVGAYLAAVTAGDGAPYSVFPERSAERLAERRQARVDTGKRIGVGMMSLLIAAAGIYVPAGLAAGARTLASQQLSAAQQVLDDAGPYAARAITVEAIEDAKPVLAVMDAEPLMSALTVVLADEAVTLSVYPEPDQITGTLSGSGKHGIAGKITTKLQGISGMGDVLPEVELAGDEDTFTLSFTWNGAER